MTPASGIDRCSTSRNPAQVFSRCRKQTFSTPKPPIEVNDIWGFRQDSELPLTPEQVLGEYKAAGIFGKDPFESISKSFTPRKRARPISGLDGQDRLRHRGSMTQGEQRCSMHRTDTIDLAVVLKGEVDIA